MTKSRNIQVLVSIGMGAYLLLVSLLFDPFFLIQDISTSWTYLFLPFSCTILTFALLALSDRIKNSSQKKSVFLSAFVLPILIPAISIWLLNESIHNSFFLYLSSFFIAALPVFAFAIMLQLINPDKNKSLNQPSSTSGEVIFSFPNKKGFGTSEVAHSKIICFEANDNYVIAHYFDSENQLQNSMTRSSLKTVESDLNEKEHSFKRVHKSYLVNHDYIVEITGKSQARRLKMKGLNNVLPVSRSFNIDELLP